MLADARRPSLESFLHSMSERRPKLVMEIWRDGANGNLIVQMEDAEAGERAAYMVVGNSVMPIDFEPTE
jgi:hypothetical protein